MEVIIISQDETLTSENVIRKFSGRHSGNANQYYQDNLAPLLDNAIKEVLSTSLLNFKSLHVNFYFLSRVFES